MGFVGQAGWLEALGSLYKVECIGSVYKVECIGSIYKVACIGSVYKVESNVCQPQGFMCTRAHVITCTHTCQNQSFAFSFPRTCIAGIWVF